MREREREGRFLNPLSSVFSLYRSHAVGREEVGGGRGGGVESKEVRRVGQRG